MLRRLLVWILRKMGRVSIYGSRGFPNEPMWPTHWVKVDDRFTLRGDVTYVQRGDDGEEKD